MTIAIVDDELETRQYMQGLVAQYLAETGRMAQLVFYPDGGLSEARFLIRTPSGMQQIFHLAKISGRIERQDPVPAGR